MNTQGAVKGGAIGAAIGGLAGFFTAYALTPPVRRTRRGIFKGHQGAYTAGGAVLGTAIGAFFGGQTTPALPGGGGRTTPSGGGSGPPNPGGNPSAYWGSLSSSQQAAYKSALWSWIVAGNWNANVQDPQSAGITSVGSLDDPGNLALATSAFQQTWNVANPNATIGGGGAGVVDAGTYSAVTR